MKKIIYLLGITLFVLSCEQPEVGYISDNIHSLQDTITVPRGVFFSSPPPAVEGSTYPLEWMITGITDKDGKPTTELQDKHEILTWTAPFDPNTDTTLELAMKKLKMTNEPAIIMNPASGEFVFTQASKSLINNNFTVNVKAKNVRGERQLDKFTHVKFGPFVPVEIMSSMTAKLECRNNKDGSWKNIGDYNVSGSGDSKIPSILDGTNPYMTIIKVSDEPKSSIKVKQIIVDSNNQILDPTKVVFNPTRLQNFHDNTINVVMDNQGSTFGLPAPPFPQYGRRNATGPGMYWMYYFTTTDSFTVDKAACESAVGPINWALYTDLATGEVHNRGYIRWAFKINDTGTWQVTMKIPNTIKK
jgi:hypothetical protein